MTRDAQDEVSRARPGWADRRQASSRATAWGVPEAAADRLARPAPDLSVIVNGSQPVVCFGNEQLADVATLGINPSSGEFLDNSGVPLRGPHARLFMCHGRPRETEEDLVRAYGACLNYFARRPYTRWFDVLQRVALDPLGRSYLASSACHLDLVQWATSPVWGSIDDADVRAALLEADAQFLATQLADRRFRVLLLNGAQVIKQVAELGLAELEVVGQVSHGYERHGRLVRGTLRGPGSSTVVLGWSINLQHSAVIDQNRAEVTAWLSSQLDDLRLPEHPQADSRATFLVTEGPRPVLAWAGGYRELTWDFPRRGGLYDTDATLAATQTGTRPWTAEGWIALWERHHGCTAGVVTDADTLDDVRDILLARRTVEAPTVAPPAEALEPAAAAAPDPLEAADLDAPQWETYQSRWEGWCDFCTSSPTQAEQLALGLPLIEDARLALRSLQQPWTRLDAPHRYLPFTTRELQCHLCERPASHAVHTRWVASPEETRPSPLDLDDLVEMAMAAGARRDDSSDYGRWVRARYHAVRRALGMDVDLLSPPDHGADPDVWMWARLADDLAKSYRAVDRVNPMDGAMEAPRAVTDLIAPAYQGLKADQERLRLQLRQWMRAVFLQVAPQTESATTTTACLWDAGIPLDFYDDPDNW